MVLKLRRLKERSELLPRRDQTYVDWLDVAAVDESQVCVTGCGDEVVLCPPPLAINETISLDEPAYFAFTSSRSSSNGSPIAAGRTLPRR